LDKYSIPYDALNNNPWAPDNVIDSRKIHADVYIDDKVLQFKGDWFGISDDAMNFKPWWKEKKEKQIDLPKVKERPCIPLEVCGYKVDQIALFTNNIDSSIEEYKKLGYDKWIVDEVYAKQQMRVGVERLNEKLAAASLTNMFRVKLAFNYDILPGNVEFELLELLDGETAQLHPEWRELGAGLSHYGFHVDDMDDAITKFIQAGYQLMSTIETQQHSNAPNKYCYAYMDTRSLGFVSKLIVKQNDNSKPKIWNPASSPPKGTIGNWTKNVIAMTNYGNLYKLAYFNGNDGGKWQRLSLFDSGELVACWIDMPEGY
jgi:hypothetical protein